MLAGISSVFHVFIVHNTLDLGLEKQHQPGLNFGSYFLCKQVKVRVPSIKRGWGILIQGYIFLECAAMVALV